MHQVWSRAEQTRSCKESHEIFPKELPQPHNTVFVPSYDKEEPAMSLLLGWEYGRLWLKEHREHLETELSKQKPYFVEPDFNWWVSKRTVVLDRRQIFMKKRLNPHVKNCNLTAFALSKDHREKIKNEEASRKNKGKDPAGIPSVASNADAASMTYSEKARKCNCKDCKQRRAGGKDSKSFEERKSIQIPWY